ncbi:MAG: 50S ribosomal protein L25 [Pyrinomonadaceae bacterium MAG19_C2-C3]|nr:50S ribosomal protein L25 [Pyrinomonadaceae bacterium MAG19_C2-C3]
MADNEEITINAIRREGRGKNDSRRLRREGMVPLTIYGGEGEAIAVAAPLRDLAAVLRSHAGANTVFTLDVEGIGASEVLFQDRQLDPVKNRLIHADLKRLVRGQMIELSIPLHLTGEAFGVKEEDGVLEQVLRQVQVRCRPRNIPDAISVDVSHLKLNDVLHVSDIPVTEDIEILVEPDTVVASVNFIKEDLPEETPVVETTEPEVIAKGKKEDGE